ncbi:MAG: hypothetical protein Q9200_006607 [Gallowayella weberi]
MEISEGTERRASVHQEAAPRISARSSEHRLYPISFTHAAVALPAPIVARVLEGFYDRLIAECRRRQANNFQPGIFVDIEINRLQFIVISQGAAVTWPFVIRFAETMKGMVERGWLSTYDGYYAAAPGDIMVYVGLRVIERGIFEEHSHPQAMTTADLPYWLVNVPEKERPSECPEFLLDLSDRDREIVDRFDKDYHRLSWDQVKKCIEDNQLDRFVRVPSDHRRYLEYNSQLKKEHGSVMNFVVKERLCWPDLNPKDTAPFNDPATGTSPSTTSAAHKFIRSRVGDIKILYNDWPYGIDERIVHLVVWTKFSLPDDPSTQELTKEMRREIDGYVDRTFCQVVPKENVIWFKNWKALKSIQSVEHFHVMLFDPDPAFIEEKPRTGQNLVDKPSAAVVYMANELIFVGLWAVFAFDISRLFPRFG